MTGPRVTGRRGLFLIFLALLDLLYGASLWRPAPEAARSPSTWFLAQIMPLPWWGMLWLAVGVVCLAGAFARRADRFAYACAGGLKTLWGMVFLLGWAAGVIERGWVGAVIWLAFACVVVFIIAPWPEAPRRIVVPPGRHEAR